MNQYLKILVLLAVAIGVNASSPLILPHLPTGMETLWILSLILGFGWVCSEFSIGTIFPSFTLQLLVSILLHDALSSLSSQTTIIVVVCTVLAAVILKSGGDEVERRLFGKIALPTILIATLGYFVTFFLLLIMALAVGIDGKTAALLAAIIGSTDPAALIPTLKSVVFRAEYKRLIDISVAESAINDAVGAIFTGAVIIMIQSGVDVASIGNVFSGILEPHNLTHLGKELFVGVLAGLIGWFIMRLYEKHKSDKNETSYDFGVVLAVPIFVFVLATFFGGNGFLAAFITGLLANYNHSNHIFSKTLEVMETNLDSLAKPAIFMMAGPLISVGDLWQNAFMGLVISLLFIFVVRPVAVFTSLLWPLLGKKITTKEALFLCIVRETGVIPIVLAVVAFKEFPALTTLMPLVAWVVIWTLTIPPALTPWWAKTLGLTEEQEEVQMQTKSPLRRLGNWFYDLYLNNWKAHRRKFGYYLRKDLPQK